jgi:L-seryl-tRNA(Ser) seleniumtransferase
MDMDARLAMLPKMDRLLEREDVRAVSERVGPGAVRDALRQALDSARERIRSDSDTPVDRIVETCLAQALDDLRLFPVQRAINASGVILHTNLGRSPYGSELLSAVTERLAGAVSVELSLPDGARGVRGNFVRTQLARLCDAEDALVVNNNAAAILLILSALAKDRDVIVSRGELVQIGGGFRIPDIITQGGARLVEVGTTNITTLDDYAAAVDDNTAALLKVHPSNFSQSGFSNRPTIKELATLKRADLPLIEDLGSGNLIERIGELTLPDPTPAQTLKQGADLVCFSGDKLLGGPQAGLIAGRRDLIARLAKHPLMRAIRPDKFTYMLLQEVLTRYDDGRWRTLAPWRYLDQPHEALRQRAAAIAQAAQQEPNACILDRPGEFGAGSLPGSGIDSVALRVETRKPDVCAAFFRRHDPPILGLVREGAFQLNLLAVDASDDHTLSDCWRLWRAQKDNT